MWNAHITLFNFAVEITAAKTYWLPSGVELITYEGELMPCEIELLPYEDGLMHSCSDNHAIKYQGVKIFAP